MINIGTYQKYRGNPENKLFYLLNSFMGGINTEFSDDSSNDVDFESIINFDMDKLGTLNKRGGFGELSAISEIFNKLNEGTYLPNIKNRTANQPNPENENDNVVYMKLLRNDNNCFRALSGFSGTDAYRKYQEMYGFQENRFTLLMITTNLEDGKEKLSKAWLYQCYLPELEYEDGEPTDTETMTINCYKTNLPVVFSWDRNLMNIETIEYYDKIYFTGNDKSVVTFDRSAVINSDAALASAFSYSGSGMGLETYTCVGTETGNYYFTYGSTSYYFTMPTVTSGDMLIFDGTTLSLNGETITTAVGTSGTQLTMTSIPNNAYVPSGLEVRHIGFNVLCTDPMHSIDTQGLSTDSIQGIYISTSDNIPLLSLPLGQSFLLNIIYTGSDNGFTVEMKEGDNDLSFDIAANTTLSTTGLKVYNVKFKDVPNGEVEIKITKTGATLEPYYDYYNVAQVDAEAKPVTQLNVGDYGLCEMYNRAVYYKADTIWFSEVNNFNYIPNYNYVTLPIEPTDKITKICYFKKAYIIFTKQRIYKMTGSFGSSDFAVSPVNMSLGCHAGGTVVPIEDTLYFSSPRGLYALKSSTFVEGFENVKELDLKVKKLTSDFTKYSEELSDPAVRFNGVSERAYATRYKDKYLLFYNNYNDKGDYAAVNDLDVLAYQFDIGAYTTYRFKEKPTFLFMVDNAIETLATVAQKEQFTEEDVLIDYDFTEMEPSSTTVTDNSGNNNDGTVRGNVSVNEGAGLTFDGTSNSYLKLDTLSSHISDGFNIKLDTQLTELTGAALVSFQQSSKSFSTTSGFIETQTANNYKARLEYDITTNANTGNDSVAYRLIYYAYDGAAKTGSLSYSLNNLIPTKTVSFDLTGVENKIIDSGTFTITRQSQGAYTETWNLNISSTYTVITTSTEIILGADVNITNRFYDTAKSWIKLGFSYFRAVANNNGCTITYRPAVKNTASLNVGSRKMYVKIDGTSYTHDIGSITSTGTHTADERTINIEYSGSKSVSIEITYNIKATLSGTYTANVSTKSAQSIEVPSITENTTTTTTVKPFTLTGSKQVTISVVADSYRLIELKQVGNKDQLSFTIDSENGNFTMTTDEGIGLTSRHTWEVVVGKTTNGYTCSIYKDSTVLKSQNLANGMVIDTARDSCFFGTTKDKTAYYKGKLYNLLITNPNITLLEYKLKEGAGDIAYDSSGNRHQATLYSGVSWIVLEGLSFNGGYVQLPSLSENVYFTNGFKIEFEGTLGGNTNNVKLLDLATTYDNGNEKNKKCSINVNVKDNKIDFNSTSLDYITYNVYDNSVDLTQNHEFTIDCTDNGGYGYDISIYIDGLLKSTASFKDGGISNVRRYSNFIGKSNTISDGAFKGILKSFKLTIYASNQPVPVYRSALYEFDTTTTDFGKPMYVELKTKGINMRYPQHMKKLKHIFAKVIGGYKYGELYFLLFADGYRVNDPRVYSYYIDENGTIVQEYTEQRDLKINEKISILGNMRLDNTRLGSGIYQTRKLIIPKKAKNFCIWTYGESSDYISFESFGFVCKLGKVKEG